jgi:saccharopine dehydrogenase-like NADP-dependent oxidoreductase
MTVKTMHRNTPRRVTILGGGNIGRAIALLLQDSGGYEVLVADRDAAALQRLARDLPGVATAHVPDEAALQGVLTGRFAVLSALPFHMSVAVAALCARLGVHYFDLTEDVASTEAIRALAPDARSVLMPQCGLAPGFIGIVGHALARQLDEPQELRLRVGALPRFPQGALGYSLTWSTEGLINEYCQPCDAIVHGQAVQVPALEGLEALMIDGVRYEAFNTSGGLGTLVATWQGRLQRLDYKTIRYPGHCASMRLLLNELRLRERRGLLKELFEAAIPATAQDVIVIQACASGLRAGRLEQKEYCAHIMGATVRGQHLSAIQYTTASGICAALDLVADGRLPERGFVRQEQVALPDFLANRFGRAYAVAQAAAPDGAEDTRYAMAALA